jgi:ankyrin repeat protein
MWPAYSDKESEEMAQILPPHANVDYADYKGRAPLIIAARKGAETIMRLLLDDPNIDVRMVDWRDKNAWVYAKERRHRRGEPMMEMIREKRLYIPSCHGNIQATCSVQR